MASQIDSVLSDIGADAVKTGMLGTGDIVAVVSEKVRQYKPTRLVVDPVMTAGSGRSLLDKKGRNELVKKLVPCAWLLTPNIPEAEFLSELSIKSYKDMKKADEDVIEYDHTNYSLYL